MKNQLTAEEIDAMAHLKDYADRSFKSKRALKVMQRLYERGLIEFDPMAGTAAATMAGIAAVAANH